MNLVWFISVGAIMANVLGELGKFPFGGNNSIGVIDVLVSLTVGFLVVWQVGIQKKIVLPREFKILIGFWVISLISLILSGRIYGGLYLVRFMLYSSLFWVGFNLIKSKVITVDNLFSKIILSGVILSILGFIQLLVFPNLAFLEIFGFDPHQNRVVSTFLDPNFLGCFLSICFLVSLYQFFEKKQKIFLLWATIFLVTIFFTFSRSAYLMVLIESLIFSFLRAKKVIFILILVGITSYFFVPQFNERINGAFSIDKSASERFYSWSAGWEIFKKNPILGVGFNNISSALDNYNLYQVHQNQFTHSASGVDSSFIFVLATTGIVGFLVYISFWVLLLGKVIHREARVLVLAIIIALFVNSQFINSLFYPEIMVLYFLILGSLLAKDS